MSQKTAYQWRVEQSCEATVFFGEQDRSPEMPQLSKFNYRNNKASPTCAAATGG